jgi:hypothetical protein
MSGELPAGKGTRILIGREGQGSANAGSAIDAAAAARLFRT